MAGKKITFVSFCAFVLLRDEIVSPESVCQVPECESADPRFNASWSPYALTNETNTCYRMAPYEEMQNGSLLSREFTYTCAPDNFAWNKTMPCEKVLYEDYNSIVAEAYMACLPSIVFGLVALGPAALALLLPETSQSALPDDVMDAENLDKPHEDEYDSTQNNDEVPRLSVSVTGDK